MAYLLMFLLFLPLSAIDLGVQGHTFPIQEKDIIEYLQERLGKLSENEIASLNESIKKKYCEAIEHPHPIDIPYAKKFRTFTFDPTITLKADIKDIDGQIIAAKGTRYNPLEEINSFNKIILFIDGTNKDHLAWAGSIEGEWVLTNGSPIKCEKIEKHPVYFDQGGVLIKKLGIEAIPAKVFKDGTVLRIEEVPL